MEINNLALWNDGWWIEGDMAWFLYSEIGALCQYSFINGMCKAITTIPNKANCTFRKYIKCIKSDDDIICLPDMGNAILFYSLQNNLWTEIKVENSDNSRLSCRNYLKLGNTLYILSNGLKKIIELDILRKKIVKYHDLSDKQDDVLGSAVIVTDTFFVVSSVYPQIYEFNCTNNESKFYKLPVGINDHLRSISYENRKIWLSGRKRKIYKWDMESNELNIYENIPADFGIYNFSNRNNKILNCETEEYEVPIFIETIQIDKYIWFIPFQTNKILYLDLETNKLDAFEIEGEEETEYSLKNRIMDHKFLLEYVKENRYIALYSLKNEQVIEIDTVTLTYRILPFEVDESYMDMFTNKLFVDTGKMDRAIYSNILKKSQLAKELKAMYIGKQIYISNNSDK